MALDDWGLNRLAVGGARGREHEISDRLGRHRFEDAQRAADVVAVVPRRLADRLADVEKRGEVHHGEDVVAPQRVANGRDVGDVSLDERPVLDGAAMAGDQVVVDENGVPRPAERLGRMAADVAGAAGDEDGARASAQWRNT